MAWQCSHQLMRHEPRLSQAKGLAWPDPQRERTGQRNPHCPSHAGREHPSPELLQKRISLQSPSRISATLPRTSCSPHHAGDHPIPLPSRNQVVSSAFDGFRILPRSKTWMAFKNSDRKGSNPVLTGMVIVAFFITLKNWKQLNIQQWGMG